MFKKLILAAGLLSAVSTSSVAMLEEWEFKPTIGADLNMRKFGFDSGFGEEHFREHYPDLDIYLGVKFHKYLGLEGGYEQAFSQQKKQFYANNTPALGFLDPNAQEKMFMSDVFVNGWNINLVGFYPICPKLRTELTGLIGVSWLTAHYSTVPVMDGDPATPVQQWESDTRSVFRLGIGIKQMITDNFGFRIHGVWEDTSKLGTNVLVPSGQHGASPNDIYTVKADSSYIVGAGFFFQIG